MLILLVLAMFICGSLMFSYWLGLAVKKNLRTVGDGNPGAFNLWHASGYKMGLLGMFLDFSKGYLPLMILCELEIIQGNEIIPVAIAPILGHAFSPFTKFKGGKAIAVTFGIWSAITRFRVSIVFAIILAIIQIIVRLIKKGKSISSEEDGAGIVAGMLLLGIYIKAGSFPDYFLLLWLGNLFIFIFVNREKLYLFWINHLRFKNK